MPSQSTLQVAVIGAGHLGQHHARNLAALPGVELVAVCDPNPEQGKKVAEANKTRWIEHVDDLPSHLAAVSIAAPTPFHFALAERFVKARIACLVEKPLTATLDEATALAELARKERALVQVGHIERFNPVLDGCEPDGFAPRYLEARRYTPFTGRSTDTSVVFDLMIHDIDLALWMVGSKVTKIEARGAALRGPLEDWAVCRLEFENGAVADIAASRVMSEPSRRIRMFSNEQVADIDFATRKRVITRGPGLEKLEHQGATDEPLRRELAQFVACVRSGEAPLVGPDEGLTAIRIADAVLQQIRSSR